MRSRIMVAVVSCLVTAAVVGGFAVAAIPNGNTINACRNKTTFVLRVIDKSLGQSCTSNETALSWSSWRWKGPYSGTLAYVVGDVVRWNGSSYLARGPAAPPTSTAPSNGTYWALIAQKGDPGPQGPPGTDAIPALEAFTTGNTFLQAQPTSWQNIPGVATTLVVPAGPDRVVHVQFSGVLGCSNSTNVNDGDGCMVRPLVDGQPIDPVLPPEGYMIAREEANANSGAGTVYSGVTTLTPGSHSILMQWQILDSPPLLDGTWWYANFWKLHAWSLT